MKTKTIADAVNREFTSCVFEESSKEDKKILNDLSNFSATRHYGKKDVLKLISKYINN